VVEVQVPTVIPPPVYEELCVATDYLSYAPIENEVSPLGLGPSSALPCNNAIVHDT